MHACMRACVRVVCVSVVSVRVCSGASRIFYGASTPKGKHQPVNFPIFAENCMKMKEFGSRGRVRVPVTPLFV